MIIVTALAGPRSALQPSARMNAEAPSHLPFRPSDVLLSPLLLASVALLAVNDWILKPAFHNALTGKLSDVAGVAALALFLRAVWPARPTFACLLAAAAFTWWKSPASQAVMDGFNGLGWWTVARVVDWTDLVALLVLPVVFAHRPPPVRSRLARRALAPAVGAGCIVAFAATSAPSHTYVFPAEGEYTFSESPESLALRMYDLRIEYMDRGVPRLPRLPVDTLYVSLELGEYVDVVVASELRSVEGGSALRLLQAKGSDGRLSPDSIRRVYERQVIEALRENRANRGKSYPLTAGAAVYTLDPRVVEPRALFQPRDTVRVSVARPAYLALVEQTPQMTWHVIFPVADADERQFAAGEHALVTRCAGEPHGAPAPPGREVPVCAVARKVTVEDARALGTIAPVLCEDVVRGGPIAGGALLLIAADAPIRRAVVEEVARDGCSPGAWLGVGSNSLGAALRRSGVRAWGMRGSVLRR